MALIVHAEVTAKDGTRQLHRIDKRQTFVLHHSQAVVHESEIQVQTSKERARHERKRAKKANHLIIDHAAASCPLRVYSILYML